MRFLVLGANGFIGQNLVQRLLLQNLDVVTYGRKDKFVGNYGADATLYHIQGNFVTENRWPTILKDIDFCYHLISTHTPKSSNEEPVTDINNNLISTLRLLEAAKPFKTRIIFASSGGTIYGVSNAEFIPEGHPTNPLCSYGITKLSIEKYLYLYRELYGMNSISLRIANPFGPGQRSDTSQGAVAVFLRRVLSGQVIDIWGDGSVVRDYIYIDDVVSALMSVIDYKGSRSVFNIGSGRAMSLLELIREIENATQKTAVVQFHQPRGFDVARNVLDNRLATNELNWWPISDFNSALIKTSEWLRIYNSKY